MKKVTAKLIGEALNERLDRQMLLIERISILIEDAKLDMNDELMLDEASMHKLVELLSAYDAFLDHFRHTTEDTVATIKQLTTDPDYQACTCEEERDADLDIDEEERPE